MRLQGKVAVVTGASRGIGAAIARRLGAEGATVVVNYAKSAGAAEEVAAAVRQAGGQAVTLQADMSKPDEIAAMFAEVKKQFGRVDILVNNAAVMERRPVEKVDVEHFDRHFNTNARGYLLAVVEAIKTMPSGGSIINVASAITRMAYPGSVVYSATKGAINMMTQVLAAELGPKGIRVNTVAPGSTRTDMNSEVSGKTKEEEKREMELTPLGRIGTPEDIADATVFLATEDARWVTGTWLDVSGGIRG